MLRHFLTQLNGGALNSFRRSVFNFEDYIMSYNDELANQIVSITKGNTDIRDIKQKLDIMYTACIALRSYKELYDTVYRILLDSGILDHFVSWCIGQNIHVLDDDDFIDFLNTESFSYKEKIVLPLINPRVNFFPEVLTSVAQRELRDM